MKTIVIKPKNKEEEVLLTKLLSRMRVEAHLVDDKTPNETTQKAIQEVEENKGIHVKDSNQLFKDLGI